MQEVGGSIPPSSTIFPDSSLILHIELLFTANQVYSQSHDLHALVKSADVAGLKEALLANPALDVRDDHNRSLLQNALFANNNDIVALLLAQGQNANDKTLGFKKRPSLHIPIEKSNREVVQMLLDAGADPSATDSTGKTGSA